MTLSGITSGLTNAAPRLTVTAVSNNRNVSTLFKYISPQTTGRLDFALQSEFIGTATITVTVNNGQPSNNTISRSFNVIVTSTGNPAPSIAAKSENKEAAAAQTVTASVAATLATTNAPAAGQYALTVSGVSGGKYVVQSSSDMLHWLSVQTNTSPFTFVDSNASKFNQQFYRAFYQP